jgi:hypothetical protein
VVDAAVLSHIGDIEALSDDLTVVVVSRAAAKEFGDETLIGKRRPTSA